MVSNLCLEINFRNSVLARIFCDNSDGTVLSVQPNAFAVASATVSIDCFCKRKYRSSRCSSLIVDARIIDFYLLKFFLIAQES